MNKKFEWPTTDFIKPVALINVLQIDKFDGMDNEIMTEVFYQEIMHNVENIMVHENILPYDMPPLWKLFSINNFEYIKLTIAVVDNEETKYLS